MDFFFLCKFMPSFTVFPFHIFLKKVIKKNLMKSVTGKDKTKSFAIPQGQILKEMYSFISIAGICQIDEKNSALA